MEVLNETKTMETIGHRGNVYAAGENTLSSILSAFEAGAQAVEIDVQLAKGSNVPILYHDLTLGGGGFSKSPDGQNRSISDYSVDDLQQIPFDQTRLEQLLSKQAGKQVQLQLNSLPRIATLHEVLAVLPTDKKLYIELKRDAMFSRSGDGLAQAVVAAVKAYQKQQQVIVTSFNVFDLEQMDLERNRESLQSLKIGLLMTDDLAENIRELRALKAWLKLDFWLPPFESVNPILVNQCHELGMKIIPWVRQESMQEEKQQLRRLIYMNLDGIMTNQPGYLARLLAKTDLTD